MRIEDLQKTQEEQAMETKQEVLQAAIEKVRSMLNQQFPDVVDFEDGSFTLSKGSASVMIIVRPFTEDDAVVECTSHVVTDAQITPEVMEWLLRKNAELHFGAFGLLFDHTIIYSYSLPVKNLDPEELGVMVSAVATIADYYDDELAKMTGGKRALDLIGLEG